MTDKEKIKENENPKVYSIHSQKGGVGKTSIALAIAGFEAVFNKKKVLLIDADLTGTSIKEIFNRKENPGDNGRFEYSYINDLILASPADFEKLTPLISKKKTKRPGPLRGLQRFYYECQEDSHIFFAPSSPNYKDILQIIPLISQEDYLHFFRHRFEDIIVTAIDEGFKVIVFDLPPGFHGLSKSICSMMIDQINTKIKRKNKDNAKSTRLESLFNADHPDPTQVIESRVVLVTTADKPDYNAIVPLFCSYMQEENQKKNSYPFTAQFDSIDFIFNKLKANEKEARLNAPFGMKKILDDLRSKNDQKNILEMINLIEKRTKDIGAVSCEDIPDFELESILKTVTKIYSSCRKTGKLPEYHSGKMEGWCVNINKTLDIASLEGKTWPVSS